MRRILLVLALLVLSVSCVLAAEPDILLVDDAGAKPLEPVYGPCCLNAQRTYAVWNVSQAGAVPATAIDAYATILWVTGSNASPKGIEGGVETLQAYIAKGGRLLLAGDRIGGSLPGVMAKVFGLDIKRFNPIVTTMNGRLADVIADGYKLELAAAGAECADYVKPAAGESAPRPEIVFWTPDRGVSHLTAARIETLGARNGRNVWFGFDLARAKNAAKAGDMLTRCVRWVTPEPPAKKKFQKLY